MCPGLGEACSIRCACSWLGSNPATVALHPGNSVKHSPAQCYVCIGCL